LFNVIFTDNVVVYGSTLEAYTCIHGLLKKGVTGKHIHHVHPPSTPPTVLNSPYIDTLMKKELEQLG